MTLLVEHIVAHPSPVLLLRSTPPSTKVREGFVRAQVVLVVVTHILYTLVEHHFRMVWAFLDSRYCSGAPWGSDRMNPKTSLL